MVQMRMEGFKKVGEDMERVIEKDDSASSTGDSEDGTLGLHSNMTHREKIAYVMHSQKFQTAIIILVLVDVVLVICELLFDLEVIESGHDSEVPHILHSASIAILSIFMLEICVKVYAMGIDFFRHKLEVFDAIIVIISLALDIVYADDTGVGSASSLLVVLRLWRVARIVNGIVISVKVTAERKVAKERSLREAVEQELAKFRQYCAMQEKEIEALESLLREHNIEYQKTEKPVFGRRIDVVAEVNVQKEHRTMAASTGIEDDDPPPAYQPLETLASS